MPKPRYTEAHAAAGLDHKFPAIETGPINFSYEIVVDDPNLPRSVPRPACGFRYRHHPLYADKLCLELKSLKEYLQSYRNLGIFQENIVNRVLEDVVRWAKPVWAEVKGDFRPRGGISTVVVARWPRPKGKKQKRDLSSGCHPERLEHFATRRATESKALDQARASLGLIGSMRSNSVPCSAFTRLTSYALCTLSQKCWVVRKNRERRTAVSAVTPRPFRATLIGSSSSVMVRYFDVISIMIAPTKADSIRWLMRMLYCPCRVPFSFSRRLPGGSGETLDHPPVVMDVIIRGIDAHVIFLPQVAQRKLYPDRAGLTDHAELPQLY
jgi:7-cyano-7-deazaguanine reductase